MAEFFIPKPETAAVSEEEALRVGMSFMPVGAKAKRRGGFADRPAARRRLDEELAAATPPDWNRIFGLPDLAHLIYDRLGGETVSTLLVTDSSFRATAISYMRRTLSKEPMEFLRQMLMRNFAPNTFWWLNIDILSSVQQYLLAVFLKRPQRLIDELFQKTTYDERKAYDYAVRNGVRDSHDASIYLFGTPYFVVGHVPYPERGWSPVYVPIWPIMVPGDFWAGVKQRALNPRPDEFFQAMYGSFEYGLRGILRDISVQQFANSKSTYYQRTVQHASKLIGLNAVGDISWYDLLGSDEPQQLPRILVKVVPETLYSPEEHRYSLPDKLVAALKQKPRDFSTIAEKVGLPPTHHHLPALWFFHFIFTYQETA